MFLDVSGGAAGFPAREIACSCGESDPEHGAADGTVFVGLDKFLVG